MSDDDYEAYSARSRAARLASYRAFPPKFSGSVQLLYHVVYPGWFCSRCDAELTAEERGRGHIVNYPVGPTMVYHCGACEAEMQRRMAWIVDHLRQNGTTVEAELANAVHS